MRMNYEPSPQNLLDAIHATNVPALFVPEMGKRQRLEAIALALAELRDTCGRIEKQMKRIEKRHKRDTEGARRANGGYRKVLELGEELIETVQDLEGRVKGGKVLPPPFAFGRKVFGSEEMDEWHLGDDDTAHNWDELMRLRLRLASIDEERRPLEARLKQLQTDLKTQQDNLDQLARRYHHRSKKRYVLIRLGFLFILGALALGAGVYLYLPPIEGGMGGTFPTEVSIGLVGIGSIIWLVIAIAIIRRQRWLVRTRDTMRETRVHIQALKEEGRQVNQRYKPVRHNYREVAVQYKQLRTMF